MVQFPVLRQPRTASRLDPGPVSRGSESCFPDRSTRRGGKKSRGCLENRMDRGSGTGFPPPPERTGSRPGSTPGNRTEFRSREMKTRTRGTGPPARETRVPSRMPECQEGKKRDPEPTAVPRAFRVHGRARRGIGPGQPGIARPGGRNRPRSPGCQAGKRGTRWLMPVRISQTMVPARAASSSMVMDSSPWRPTRTTGSPL